MPGTQFYRTSLCHCPNVASSGASRLRKSSPLSGEPEPTPLPLSSPILRSNVAESRNHIVEK